MDSIKVVVNRDQSQEHQELKETFKMFDLNNDGIITKEELGIVMKRLGRETNDRDLETMIRDVDTNGNGVVELDEFINMMKAQTRTMTSDEAVRQAFQVFDKNGDNFINKDEIRFVVEGYWKQNIILLFSMAMNNLGENVTEAEVNEMLQCMDLNKDGRVSFEEFKKMFE